MTNSGWRDDDSARRYSEDEEQRRERNRGGREDMSWGSGGHYGPARPYARPTAQNGGRADRERDEYTSYGGRSTGSYSDERDPPRSSRGSYGVQERPGDDDREARDRYEQGRYSQSRSNPREDDRDRRYGDSRDERMRSADRWRDAAFEPEYRREGPRASGRYGNDNSSEVDHYEGGQSARGSARGSFDREGHRISEDREDRGAGYRPSPEHWNEDRRAYGGQAWNEDRRPYGSQASSRSTSADWRDDDEDSYGSRRGYSSEAESRAEEQRAGRLREGRWRDSRDRDL